MGSHIARYPNAHRKLFARLRQSFDSVHKIPEALPILFFGDIFSNHLVCATVGLNPSWREYLSKAGRLLTGPNRRLHTLHSLGAPDRAGLTDVQCLDAISLMQSYFVKGRPYGWFGRLSELVGAAGFSYHKGTAVHLDLVQEAVRVKYTDPNGQAKYGGWSQWIEQNRPEVCSQLSLDLAFLRWQLESFPVSVVLCDGGTACRAVAGQLGVVPDHLGTMAVGRNLNRQLHWQGCNAVLNSRPVGLIGWSRPLWRAGLTSDQHRALEEHVRSWLEANSLTRQGS